MFFKFSKYLSYFIFPIIIFLLAVFFYVSGIYARVPNVDIPLHFFGGISIAYMAILFLRDFEKRDFIKIRNKFVFVLVVVSVVCMFAILWEIWEFFAQRIFESNFFMQGNLEDTILDLFFGMVGGIIGGIFSKI